ncbi:subtilase, partial [Helicosporidium sp. ATCC 50920]
LPPLPAPSKRPLLCIIDSGVDASHPDLAGLFSPDDTVSYLRGDASPADLTGHGTAVAGIVAALGNNGLQGSGVVWAGVRLASCKFLDAFNLGATSGAIQCVRWCLSRGAKVLSNSWGGSSTPSATVREALRQAKEAGALFVVAAGNQGQRLNDDEPTYPARYAREFDNVIVVGSSTRQDATQDTSNRGVDVHIMAPGEDILTTAPGGGMASVGGTSMAAPYVSGTAALLMSSNPDLDPVLAKRAILATARKVESLAEDNETGGILDVEAALKLSLACAYA